MTSGLKAPEMKKLWSLQNRTDPDEVAHNEPSHLDLHCLHSILKTLHGRA